MIIAFSKDILYVEVDVLNLDDFVVALKRILLKDHSNFSIDVEDWQYNWLNTIVKPLKFNLLVPVNKNYILTLRDCRIVSVEKNALATAVISMGDHKIEKTETTPWRAHLRRHNRDPV